MTRKILTSSAALVALVALLAATAPSVAQFGPVPGGGGTAAQVTVDASGFSGNLSSADDTVQKALVTLDTTAGGAGIGTDAFVDTASVAWTTTATELWANVQSGVVDALKLNGYTGAFYEPSKATIEALLTGTITTHAHNAADLVVDASGFSGNLSATDDTAQKALATLDSVTFDASSLSNSGTTFVASNASANMTIGETDLAGTTNKLYVDADHTIGCFFSNKAGSQTYNSAFYRPATGLVDTAIAFYGDNASSSYRPLVSLVATKTDNTDASVDASFSIRHAKDSAGTLTTAFIINDSSNVSINNTDTAGTTYRLSVGGAMRATGAAALDGGITVDSTAFTVADSTGNVATTGTLTVGGATQLNGGLTMDTDKFTVADGTGNTAIAGTLGVAGVASFAAGSAANPSIAFTGDPDVGLYSGGTNILGFATNGIAHLTINSAGVVNLFSRDQPIPMYITSYSNTYTPNITGIRTRGSVGSQAAVQSGDLLFSIAGRGHDGTVVSGTSGLVAIVAAETYTSTAQGSLFRVETTPTGSTTASREVRAIINSSGNMTLGATDIASTTSKLYVDGTTSIAIMPTTASAANMFWDTTTKQLQVSTSSRRYKTDIEPLAVDWNKYMTLNPVSFRPVEKPADSQKFLGFIAEELHPLYPELVGMKDGQPESVHYGHITAINTEAIQDLKRENAELKATLDAVMRRLELLEASR
jgi:hypothetical protein